jgi:hypothetical protein
MTMLSVRGDSVRAGVVLERLVPASAPAGLSWWSLPRLSRRDSSLPPAALSDRGSLETSPLLTLSEPMARRSLIPLRLAKELIDALDEMRSCSMKQHLGDRSVPWCWRKENEAGMVKGFFAARRRRESTRD